MEAYLETYQTSAMEFFSKHRRWTFLVTRFFYITGPLEQGGAEVAPVPPKFSVDVPFFADEPFKRALFERSNQKCT